MRAFNSRLERALAQGAVLAALTASGCAGKADGSSTPTAGTGGGSSGAGTKDGSSGAGAGGGNPGAGEGSSLGGDGSGLGGSSGRGLLLSKLPPLPSDAVQCTGPDYDAGYHGQCCAELTCMPSQAGTCMSAEQADLGVYGSGSCLCGEGKTGPYARDNDCCYLVHSIGCDGRPLLVEGDAVVSPLTLKSDWLTPNLLELLAV